LEGGGPFDVGGYHFIINIATSVNAERVKHLSVDSVTVSQQSVFQI